MRALALLPLAGLLLAACAGDRPSAAVWACAGQSDLVVTTSDEALTILVVNTDETLTLTETEVDRAWATGTVFWRIVGVDHAIFQTPEGRVLNCRRPG